MKTAEQKFWERVDVRGPDECWLWLGRRRDARRRYGEFTYEGKRQAAHRVVMLLGGVRLSRQNEVHHRCENKLCVNPAHLEVFADGRAHMEAHGRIGCRHHGEQFMRTRSDGNRFCGECQRVWQKSRVRVGGRRLRAMEAELEELRAKVAQA